MGYWHEPMKFGGSLVRVAKDRKTELVVRRGEISEWEAHFRRWELDGPARNRRVRPDGWVMLWPKEAITGSDAQSTQAAALHLLELAAERMSDHLFDLRPFELPARPSLIKEIEHPTARATARIVQRLDGNFEATYLVYAPDGKYFPASTPSIGELGWEWGVTWADDENGAPQRTLANDMASLEEIAVVELDALVQADPEIRPR